MAVELGDLQQQVAAGECAAHRVQGADLREAFGGRPGGAAALLPGVSGFEVRAG
jgi:hypothetical protein